MKSPALVQRHQLWSALFLIWFVALWLLSSRPLMGPRLPTDFPIDKVYHFGYFFGGAGLLSAALFLQKRWPLHWSTIHLLVVLVLSAIGSLDEWHQSWYPFRSGNDAGDLTANILGALVGTLVFRKVQPRYFSQASHA